ncbi:alpha-beta hydrolase superfamily lysophospholipase [Bradyrhizobium sp. LA8.1]
MTLAKTASDAKPAAHHASHKGSDHMSTVTMKDGTTIYYKDWSAGPVMTFSHGWPLTADAWDAQMLFLQNNGYRVIAHDRRSHGRSDQTWTGNDMDTYADDLAASLKHLTSRARRWSVIRPAVARSPVMSAVTARRVCRKRF